MSDCKPLAFHAPEPVAWPDGMPDFGEVPIPQVGSLILGGRRDAGPSSRRHGHSDVLRNRGVAKP